jgi:predicted RNA-binding protein associated with RNAse of E/G family
LVDKGLRKFDIVVYTEDEKAVAKIGTYYIDIIQYTDTQRFIVAPDQTVEI